MFFVLSLVFFLLAFLTGANTYVIKNTLSHWLVSLLSAIASAMAAWTCIYYATRSFFDPNRIVLDTFAATISLSFPNHPSTHTMVFGNFWLLACLLPMIAACLLVRELRKLPELSKELPMELAVE